MVIDILVNIFVSLKFSIWLIIIKEKRTCSCDMQVLFLGKFKLSLGVINHDEHVIPFINGRD